MTDTGNMQPRLAQWMPYGLIGLLAAWLSTFAGDPADWQIDAAPAVQALADGHLGDYLNAKALMGPFATLVQAPFVAVSGTQGAAAYPWAVFPCLLIAGFVGLYLARIAARRGAGLVPQALIAVLFLLNPLTFEAIENGHPEEILTAALAVAAVAAAAEHRLRSTALLLGLAIASKQWAVIAVLPALMALPAARVRVGITAAAVAALLFLPAVAASPSSFLGVQSQAAGTGQVVTPWSAWYPFASSETRGLRRRRPKACRRGRERTGGGRPTVPSADRPAGARRAVGSRSSPRPPARPGGRFRPSRPACSPEVRSRPGRQPLLPRALAAGADWLGRLQVSGTAPACPCRHRRGARLLAGLAQPLRSSGVQSRLPDLRFEPRSRASLIAFQAVSLDGRSSNCTFGATEPQFQGLRIWARGRCRAGDESASASVPKANPP